MNATLWSCSDSCDDGGDVEIFEDGGGEAAVRQAGRELIRCRWR